MEKVGDSEEERVTCSQAAVGESAQSVGCL